MSIPVLNFYYDYVLPNTVLPNALKLEFSLINFLHTLHDNRLSTNSFFEDKFSIRDPHDTVVPYLYGTSIGSWPNSLRTNGSHMKGGPYPTLVNIIENSLYFGKQNNPTKKYFYPIKVPPHFDKFTGVDIPEYKKLNGEYFWKHMSEEALNDVRNGRGIIFLDYAQENFIDLQDYRRLHTSLKWAGIPPENIILGFNSYNAKELYESWFAPEERKLEVWNWPFVTSNTSYHYELSIKHNTNGCISENEFKQSVFTLRKKHFLFKIRRRRYYRLAFLYKIVSDGLIEKFDWSCLEPHEFNENDIEWMSKHFQYFIDKEKVQQIYKQIPHLLESEKDKSYYELSAWNGNEADIYKNSYVYLCTESFTDKPYKSLTEKTFKPIANFMPFLVFGSYKTLELLQELGFKTFSPWIDESYDNEQDEVIRFQKISAEITRLCSMPLEELHKWYWEMEDILVYNRNHLLNLYKEEKESIKLINYMYERTGK